MTLRVSIAGREVGSAKLARPEQFAVDFPLPNDLVGRDSIEITVEVDNVLRAPGEVRELGMVFGTFGIH